MKIHENVFYTKVPFTDWTYHIVGNIDGIKIWQIDEKLHF